MSDAETRAEAIEEERDAANERADFLRDQLVRKTQQYANEKAARIAAQRRVAAVEQAIERTAGCGVWVVRGAIESALKG